MAYIYKQKFWLGINQKWLIGIIWPAAPHKIDKNKKIQKSRNYYQGSKDCLSRVSDLILVTYRFVDFNVGGAFDKSYFTAPFRGIYAFSAQIGTKKRVNTYIFMQVIRLFKPFDVRFISHQGVIDEDGKFELSW